MVWRNDSIQSALKVSKSGILASPWVHQVKLKLCTQANSLGSEQGIGNECVISDTATEMGDNSRNRGAFSFLALDGRGGTLHESSTWCRVHFSVHMVKNGLHDVLCATLHRQIAGSSSWISMVLILLPFDWCANPALGGDSPGGI